MTDGAPDPTAVDLDPAAVERLRRVGGEKLLRDMIDLFLTHAPGRVANAMAARDEGDVRTLERAVHSLKSTAGNLGGTAVQLLSQEIEDLAAAGDLDAAAARLPELERRFERLRSSLLAVRPAAGPAEA